jgi:translocation and assembly module TamB
MAVGKRRSKKFWALLSVVSFLVLGIAALPLWFPWALRPIAKRFGATYDHYQRLGYTQFQLTGVSVTTGPAHVEAGRVKAFVPTVWLWKHLTGERGGTFAEVQSWKYETIKTQSTHSSSNAPVSVHKIYHIVQTVVSALHTWLPSATITNGTVVIQKQILTISQALWTNDTLTATAVLSNAPALSVVVTTKQYAPWTVNIGSEPHMFHSAFSLDDKDEKLVVTGSADWLTNHADIAAEFPRGGYIPDTAIFNANALKLPTRLLQMEQYGDIEGSFHASWHTNHFNIQAQAKTPSPGTNLPPLDIDLRASGDTHTAQLDAASISTPGLQASLPGPVAISFQSPFLSQPTTLTLAADLDQQHWFLANGKITGQVVVYPGKKFPRVSFTLAGTGVTTISVTTSNLEMNGELNWPVLDLQRAQIVMDDSSHIDLAAQYNFAEKTILGGRLNSSGAFGGQYLPAGYSFDSASVSAQFNGPLTNITNSAKAQVTHLSVPHVSPVDIGATWNGEGLNFKTAEMTVKTGTSSLLLRGSTAIEPKKQILTLTALEFSDSNHLVMRLEKPAQIALDQSGKTGTNAAWNLSIEPLVLSGEGREFHLAGSVRWPERGALQCEAHGLDARLLRDFILQADTDALLNHFAFDGGWTNGPVTFQLTADATLKTREQFPFSAVAKISGGKAGIAIEQFSVLSATQVVCRADGSLPISFDPARKGDPLQIDDRAPLKLHALTDPKSILWKKIAEATGLRLQEPNLTANLEGTWAAPQGQVTLQVERIELSGLNRPLPSVENVDLVAVMDRATARVSRFNFEVEKQRVNVTGEIPLGESFWSGLQHKSHLPDWHEATAHLQIDNAQVAAFTSLLPEILSAEGTASADISLERGGNLRGQLSVTNAGTHPLESVGPVRNIQILAHLDGQTVRLDNASGEIGGQRVNVDGSMQLNEQIWRTNGLPLFQVHVSGTNVPLARNPSILLRANIDLSATNSGTEVPVVYGSVKLRDSLFLADLQALVPERTASARKRPPYFSVEIEPWAQWRLNVNVTGNSFLRAQTPLFHGKVSTVLTLQGTMKDPYALGQVKIDPGSSITFPFSSLDVKQGFISLTSEDPYSPQLFVTAEARRFGYDIKMEATGPVDHPLVQFSSIPGLSSEEIVLMLTAGQIPRGVGATASTQQRAQGLALFVGKNLLSDFGLGGGGQERLTVRSGEDISESGRPTYDIEYKLTDRWSVIGEYDRFDQYNLNLKFKAYSK